MRSQRLFIIALLTCAGIAAFVAIELHSPEAGITEENFSRVRAGMTEQEVEALFGDPGHLLSVGKNGEQMKCWKNENDTVLITVHFGSPPAALAVDGRIDREDGSGWYNDGNGGGMVSRLRRWLGL